MHNIVINENFTVSSFFALAQKEIVSSLLLDSNVLDFIPDNNKLKSAINRLKMFPKEVDSSAVYSVFRFSILSKTVLDGVDFSKLLSAKNLGSSVARIEKDSETGCPIVFFAHDAFVGAINRFLNRFTHAFEQYVRQVGDNKRLLLNAKYEPCRKAFDAEFNGNSCYKFLPIYSVYWYRVLFGDAPRVFIKDMEFVVYDYSNTKVASSPSLLDALKEEWAHTEKKLSSENMEETTALVVKGVVAAGGKRAVGRNSYTKSSGIEMVTDEYDDMAYAVFRRDRYSTCVIGALPDEAAVKSFKTYMLDLVDKHKCSFYSTYEQFEFGGMYDRKDVWVAPFNFKSERMRHFTPKVKIYSFRGGGKFDSVSSAVAFIKKTAKKCVYTYGFESKGPTTHREPISKEDAVKRIENSKLVDVYEEYDTIHVNAYFENDMW